MQLPPTNSARTLDTEFKRVAEQEDKSMEELVEEISQLVNRKAREIYNWRSGKWPLPSNFIPILCRRFKSLALVNALVAECSDVEIEIPDGYELTRMVSKTVRGNLHGYERYLDAFESNGIEPHELQQLRECMENIVRDAHTFLDIAARDCERRTHAEADVSDRTPRQYAGR